MVTVFAELVWGSSGMVTVFALIFSPTVHARKPILEKNSLFIETNSFIIVTCLNPVELVLGFR
jgi:hypothetical protein